MKTSARLHSDAGGGRKKRLIDAARHSWVKHTPRLVVGVSERRNTVGTGRQADRCIDVTVDVYRCHWFKPKVEVYRWVEEQRRNIR